MRGTEYLSRKRQVEYLIKRISPFRYALQTIADLVYTEEALYILEFAIFSKILLVGHHEHEHAYVKKGITTGFLMVPKTNLTVVSYRYYSMGVGDLPILIAHAYLL